MSFRRLGAWLREVVDARDLTLAAGLALAAWGAAQYSAPLGALVPGAVLLWLAIGPDVVREFRRPERKER